MKKKLTFFLIVCFTMVSIFANGQKAEQDTEEVQNKEVRAMLCVNEAQMASYEALFKRIKEDTGITVKGDYVKNWDEFNQKLMTQMAAKNPPDILDVSVIYKDQYISNNYLMDMTPYMEDFDFIPYYGAMLDSYRKDGKIYGFPNGCTSIAVYYNKALFDEAGLEYPTSDWSKSMNWDQFLQTVTLLTKDDSGNKQYGFSTTFEIGWLLPLIWQHNARFISEDGTKCAINTKEGIEALEYVQSIMFDNNASPSYSELKSLGPADLFKAGKLATFMDGDWWMGYFSDIEDFEWGVAALPQDERSVTGFYIDGWAIANRAKNPKDAAEVIKYFASKEGLTSGIAKGTPPMISLAEKEIESLYPYVDDATRQTWKGALAIGETPSFTKNWAQVVSEANKVLERMSLGLVTPAEAAAEMETNVNRVLL
ncbi:MAG: sugar ABC transporter substrate-binding protein [Sphaerochaetaceae bacterium]|nr:sugar ABC transporter substrate-binding protein [Sphaerochaetaceae bacterium]